MAFIQCDFYSEVLKGSTSMNVILPQLKRTPSQTHKLPTLYLLHGLSDDHTIWQRRTSIERYADMLELAVVMPNVNRSFYANMVNGYEYWTFISEELPAIARWFFPLSDVREHNFVAGLSMGGYGAFKLAFACPEKFAAAASLSGALDVERMYSAHSMEFKNIFGEIGDIKGSENDLFYLAKKLAGSDGPKPILYQSCGIEDYLYKDNLNFRDFITGLSLNLTYEEEPGEHEWGYWDQKIKKVLHWLKCKFPEAVIARV